MTKRNKNVKKPPSKWVMNAGDEYAISQGAKWDNSRGEFFCDTVEENFRLYEGNRYAGELIQLLPYQREFFMRMFSWVVYSEFLGRWIRRFRRARLWVPKKNGKSPSAAMVGVYLMCADGELGGKTYSAAKDGKQARIVHDHAIKMVEQSPELMAECQINMTNRKIAHVPTDSWYGVISGDNIHGQEGLNGNSIIDEAHVVDSRLAGVLEYMGASRDEPIDFAVSTAGTNLEGWGKQQWDYGERVNSGEAKDIEFLHQAFAAPQNATDEELDNPKLWHQANPALGHIINPEVFKRELAAAKKSASSWARFKMYRFNIWGSSSTPWLDMEAWRSNTHAYSPSDFSGQPGYLGLDMSLTRDMTGCTLVVPVPRDEYDGEDGGHEEAKEYYLFPLLWITRSSADRNLDKAPYDEWAQDGHLRIIESDKIDFKQVRADIIEAFSMLDIQTLTYDATYASETAEMLCTELDCERIEFRQTAMEFAEPTQMFERLLPLGLLKHPDNKVLNWQARHCEVTIPDRSGNYRPVKPATSDRAEARTNYKTIDGIVSSVMALREARKFEAYVSYYEDNAMESF